MRYEPNDSIWQLEVNGARLVQVPLALCGEEQKDALAAMGIEFYERHGKPSSALLRPSIGFKKGMK